MKQYLHFKCLYVFMCFMSLECHAKLFQPDPCLAQPGFSSLQPVISPSSNPNQLTCDIDNATYEWYLDGTLLPSATTQLIQAGQSGIYEVIATRSGCASQRSVGYVFTLNESYERIGGNHIWYFGQNAGLDFRTSPPSILLDGALNTDEGCATISDPDGNLLFYTDGLSVWNKDHSLMPNGTGLLGDPSATQSSVVVPHPGEPDQYFIFTVPASETSGFLTGGLYYSIVDMSLDGGLGDLLSKNTFLIGPIAEKVTSVVHQNDQHVWIVTHLWNSDAFYAYLIDDLGLNSVPIVSNVGSVHQGDLTNSAGYLKASVDGSKIALARLIYLGIPDGSFPSQIEIFDFDNVTGIVSNPITTTAPYFRVYGLEFSPDSRKLYFANNTPTASADPMEIYQIDLEAGSATDIINSATIIGTHTKSIFTPFAGALQLGRDGKIYVSILGSNFLGAIQNPNASGLAADYTENGADLGGRVARFGLPNFIYSANSLGEPLTASTILLDVEATSELVKLYWYTNGDFSHFMTQKSLDGTDFFDIGKVDAVTGQQKYSFNDLEYHSDESKIYYRVQGFYTNHANEALTSQMVLLEGNQQGVQQVNIFPNPTTDNQKLYIQFSKPVQSKVYLRLKDSQGKLILVQDILPEEITNQEFISSIQKKLPQGIYFLQLRSLDFQQAIHQKLLVY